MKYELYITMDYNHLDTDLKPRCIIKKIYIYIMIIVMVIT